MTSGKDAHIVMKISCISRMQTQVQACTEHTGTNKQSLDFLRDAYEEKTKLQLQLDALHLDIKQLVVVERMQQNAADRASDSIVHMS